MCSEMTDNQKKAFEIYIRHIANESGLRDWTIVLNWDELPSPLNSERHEETPVLSVYCVSGQKRAVVRIDEEEFLKASPDRQRHFVVHEMVHPHLAGMEMLVEDDVKPLLGQPAYHLFVSAFERALEYAVDGLAEAIAPNMPLIDWDKTEIE